MRYIEYVYLAVAAMVVVFLATNLKNMAGYQIALSALGAGISAFMFSFRRAQRISFEKQEKEEMEELKKKAGEDV